MKKLGFLSNLLYALRRRMGWCPKPPAPKDVILAKLTQNKLEKRVLYYEKPPAPWSILFYPFICWSVAVLLLMFPSWGGWKLGLYPPTQEAILPLFVWLVFLGFIAPFIHLQSIPSILKRKILLTAEILRIEYGLYKDQIPLQNIKSIAKVERPLLTYRPPWGIRRKTLHSGVAKTGGARWYFFGADRHYMRINRWNGIPICIGLGNPKEFAGKLSEIAPSIGSSLLKEIEEEEAEEDRIRRQYQQVSPDVEALYDRLLKQRQIVEGQAKIRLESQIRDLIEKGYEREQAIREIAEKEKVLF